ncbi:hypothetical protein N9E38_02565, partial [Yoonia sp.]|nr:hypothetical protein [Yoonia sp.]
YGGYGNDLINADDKLDTAGVEDGSFAGLNNLPDADISYEDFVFGGAGRDFMIANTAGDRLVDWNGDFNEYYVPYRNAGVPTVINSFNTTLETYILRVAASDGADPTRAADVDPILIANGTPLSVNGDPYGELGLVNNNSNNPVNLAEFSKNAQPTIIPFRGTVDNGTILPDSSTLIPSGAQLANSELDNFGFTPTVSAVTGLYAGDATTIETPLTADTGANRADAAMITTFTDTVGIVVGGTGPATVGGITIGTEPATYVYDEASGDFVPSDETAVQVAASGANTVLELFDTDGELFAYVDDQGGVWIIDDVNDNPDGQRDRTEPAAPDADPIEDDWLLEATVVTNGSAAVALPLRTTRN